MLLNIFSRRKEVTCMAYHKVALEIKNQVLSRLKEGIPATQLAIEHGISVKTIYGWLSGVARSGGLGLLETGQLRRKVAELTELVGELSLELHSLKKKKIGWK